MIFDFFSLYYFFYFNNAISLKIGLVVLIFSSILATNLLLATKQLWFFFKGIHMLRPDYIGLKLFDLL